jgi:hypothetical protein
MQHSAESNLIIEYLCEYELIFEMALAHESGDLGVLFSKKNRGSKISWDCLFKEIRSWKTPERAKANLLIWGGKLLKYEQNSSFLHSLFFLAFR